MLQEIQESPNWSARIEALLQEVATFSDPQAQAVTEELLQTLLAMYGEGLTRMLEITAEHEVVGETIIDEYANDELVNSLLLLHGLHPIDVETRITQALESVRPYLKSHGGNVELLRVRDNVAYLRLQGSCNGCPSSSVTLKLAIEEAINKAAPDLESLQVDGVTTPPRPINVTPLRKGKGEGSSESTNKVIIWNIISGLDTLADGGLVAKTVQQTALVFCRVGETYYAYRNRCRNCSAPLDQGRLELVALVCGACGKQYDVTRAGRCLDTPNLFLEPIPLLVKDGQIKVSLPTSNPDADATSVQVAR
ncbi:MAG: NifU family protein [Ktedonobacteraceae bacterium]|nr:NifU family protein [Ktedonobacteraceae bacterium]